MPQHDVSTSLGFAPGTSARTSTTGCAAANAFWWQCAWTRIGAPASAKSTWKRPAPASRATNSSNSSACFATVSAFAPSLSASAVDVAGRQERATAAVVAARLRERVHGVAGGVQDARGGDRVLALEDAVEGVDEEHRRLAVAARGGDRRLGGREQARVVRAPERVAAPARQRAVGGEAEQPLAQQRRSRQRSERVGERRDAGERVRNVGQLADDAVLQRAAVAPGVLGEDLDLHPRHVDAGRALALAALAAD